MTVRQRPRVPSNILQPLYRTNLTVTYKRKNINVKRSPFFQQGVVDIGNKIKVIDSKILKTFIDTKVLD